MTAAAIMKQIDQLIKLHKSLLKLAEQKTEAITHNNIQALEKLLNEEQMHVKAINQVENQRQKEVVEFGRKHSSATSLTMSDIIASIEGSEKEQLILQREELVQLSTELKNKNNLNQQLIFNSLQYINLTLDMLRPQDMVYNYDKPAQASQQTLKKGMFDSQA
ncbi:flagellar protein FlgN [Bacillus massiliigorillae]|uniref:flagellar protein FlgN n=1 Tax=Bacillus massiliigorillae TaxID=1243664 RepID=UPI00039E65F5|nr:flagellar protein FlgN [Bacillus massiliigorillae]